LRQLLKSGPHGLRDALLQGLAQERPGTGRLRCLRCLRPWGALRGVGPLLLLQLLCKLRGALRGLGPLLLLFVPPLEPGLLHWLRRLRVRLSQVLKDGLHSLREALGLREALLQRRVHTRLDTCRLFCLSWLRLRGALQGVGLLLVPLWGALLGLDVCLLVWRLRRP
jgi:hypothetical protein